ncbi:MAG: hypothetical protein ABIR66_04460 [Saprospiraceae bacterium]
MRQDHIKPQKSADSSWILMIVLHLSILLALLFLSFPVKKVIPSKPFETEIRTSNVAVQKPTA